MVKRSCSCIVALPADVLRERKDLGEVRALREQTGQAEQRQLLRRPRQVLHVRLRPPLQDLHRRLLGVRQSVRFRIKRVTVYTSKLIAESTSNLIKTLLHLFLGSTAILTVHRMTCFIFRNDNMKDCLYGRKDIGYIDNRNTITFGNRIGRTPNPFVQPFTTMSVR